MEEQTLQMLGGVTDQAPALVIFATVVGLLVRHFLAHLKVTATEHKEAMVEVVRLTSDALAKNSEAIFEHSRLVGSTLQALKDRNN